MESRGVDYISLLVINGHTSVVRVRPVFGFDNDETKINVPLDLLMIPAASIGRCSIPSIIDVEHSVVDGLTSLCNSVLQASYAVFDCEGKKILLGQATMNAAESDLVEYTVELNFLLNRALVTLHVKGVGIRGYHQSTFDLVEPECML